MTEIKSEKQIILIQIPQYTMRQWIEPILWRIVFPPILVWDVFKWLFNALCGKWTGKLVLRAQRSIWTADDNFSFSSLPKEAFRYAEYTIQTHDGAKLDTLEVRPKDFKSEPQHQKYIINFVGNDSYYERILEKMQKDAQQLNCTVVGFNYRGVKRSEGIPQSKDDLVTDGIAQVQRLLNQGVSPQNITLKGHSLGAGIASLVAYHFHQQRQPLNIFNNRSFSSLTNVLVGRIRSVDDSGHKETWDTKLLGWLAKPLVKFALSLVNWEINADDAFKAIPLAYRDYMVVRTKRTHRAAYVDDPMIVHYASIHTALRDERRKYKAVIDDWISAIDSEKIKNGKLETAQAFLKKARSQSKNRKMQLGYYHEYQNYPHAPMKIWQPGTSKDCHDTDVDIDLCSYSEDPDPSKRMTPDTLFKDFVKRAWQDHGLNPEQKETKVESEAIQLLRLTEKAMDISISRSYALRGFFAGTTVLIVSGILVTRPWDTSRDLSFPSFHLNDPLAQFNIPAVALLSLGILFLMSSLLYRYHTTNKEKEILNDLIENAFDQNSLRATS